MSRQAVLVQLPKPCAESWEAMTPTAAGRHCAACQHEVIDFTTMSDGELAAYLARPGKVPCGRFRQSQLDRVLLPAAQPVAGWRRWWGAVAAVLGLGALTTPARAQAVQGQPAAVQQPHTPPMLGRISRPATTPKKAACPGTPQVSTMGERVLAGAPMAVPVPPAKTRKKKQ